MYRKKKRKKYFPNSKILKDMKGIYIPTSTSTSENASEKI